MKSGKILTPKQNQVADSEKMIQLLLFTIYVLIMGVLISAVINEPISGVVILIFGLPVTAIYLALAIVGLIISGHSRQNIPEKYSQNELGTANPSPTQIKIGPVRLQELPSEQKRGIKMIIFLFIVILFLGLPILEISINQGWI
jgi:hypothetical protein